MILDRFDVVMSKIKFKKKYIYIILMYFQAKSILKCNCYYNLGT